MNEEMNKELLDEAIEAESENLEAEKNTENQEDDEPTKCSICNALITDDEPAILTMSGYGNPRYICEDCVSDLDEASLGREESKIAAAMDRIGSKMLATDPDNQTYRTVTELMAQTRERALKIREGTYDFALDEIDDEGFDEIPEELAETEEDKEKDRIDEEKQKKFDKFYNYALIGAGVGLLIFIIWKIISTFFLK